MVFFRVRATFLVFTTKSDPPHVEKGTEVVATLKYKLRTDAEMLDFNVIQLDTLGKSTLLLLLFVFRDLWKECGESNF